MTRFDFSAINIFETEQSFLTNACVGKNCIHDMQTYAEGYLKSAQILADHVIKPEKMSDRDILVHPILYSVRHAIELSIKHVLIELNDKANVKTDINLIIGHCLKPLWELFKQQASFDRRLVKFIEEIDPLVLHIDSADSEGQDFRYPTNINGDKTYDGRMTVDLAAVRNFIHPLRIKVMFLFDLTEKIISERIVGAYTDKFNREELEQLSKDLPDIESWRTPAFKEVKSRWISKYKISNRAFSGAVDFIKKHREFSGNIGNEHALFSLDGDLLKSLAKEKHRIRKKEKSYTFLQYNRLALETYNKFCEKLSASDVAELQAIYYLGSSSELSEWYENGFELRNSEVSDSNIKKEFEHIFSKIDFVKGMINGLNKIGMISLASELKQYEYEGKTGIEIIDLTL